MSEGREALERALNRAKSSPMAGERADGCEVRSYVSSLESDRDALRAEVERLRADKGCAQREALLCNRHEELWLDKVCEGCGWCAAEAERARLAKLEPLAEAAREYERLLALDDIELDPAKNWPAVHAATDRLRAAIRRAYPHH